MESHTLTTDEAGGALRSGQLGQILRAGDGSTCARVFERRNTYTTQVEEIMRRFEFGVLLAGTSLAILGCGSDGVVAACRAAPSIAIEISVRDSVTGAAAATSALGIIESGGVVDTLFVRDSLKMSGGSALGTYSVRVDRPGYLTWSAPGVHVTHSGMCGNVEPVELSARLKPATP